MSPFFEQTIGALLLMVILLDIFLTVLYARIGAGIISVRMSRWVWRCFLLVSKPFPRRRPQILSFCGPIIVVLATATWALGLAFGAGLIIHPRLGTAVRAASGPTPTDFVTAFYAGGSSISVVGSSDLVPQTSGFRLFYLLNSVVGLSAVSMTLTYLMQIYTALQQRNALGLKLHLLTVESDDAAEFVAGLGPAGQFSSGYSHLAELAAEVTQVKELHHFYPVLFYFRFPDAYYSVSMSVFIALDTVALLITSLSDDEYRWLTHSAAVSQLRRAALLLVSTLEDTFLPGGSPDRTDMPDAATCDRWQRRYIAACERFQQAGIQTVPNRAAGAAAYVSERMQWDSYIRKLAPALAYTMDEIDPAGSRPTASEEGKLAHA